jgi:U3 small nucleolar RNA-associated protein 10
VKLPDLASHVADMAKKYVCDELLCVLVVALAGAVTAHANYERVLTEVIVDVELSDVAVLALVRELAVTGTKDAAVGADANGAGGARDNTAEREAAARALRLCDAHHPIACSAAVDKVLAEAARRAVVASDGVEVAGDAAGSGKTKRAKDDAAKPKPAESPFAAFLRWALSGSAAGPMPGHAASLGAALDHPQPGLREAALKELKRGGSSAKTMSSGTVLAGALLRRVSDDKPRVAAAAAGLPGVRVAIGDDDALFDAASERLNVAAAKCAGKTPEAELERAVAKRCVKLLVGVLSTPPRRPGAAGGEGAEKSAEKGAEESDAEESDSEESDSEASVEAAADGAAGPLAGRAAATAFAHVLFSPSTRAVARAALDAAARNPHPLLWKFREKAFQKAVAEAQSIGGAPTPDAKASKRKSLKKEKEVEAKDVDAAAQKEARARSDAAVNALVITALAEGLSAWNDVDAMTLWVKETWRDGTNRARGTLLLSLREACGRASAAAARAATWTVAKDAWNDEDVGASVLGEREDGEDAKRGDAPLSKHTARALSKNGDAAAAVLPALTRRALLAMLDATCARKGNDHGNGRERRVLKEIFLAMAAADDESGEGRFKTHFDALLRASERSGVSSTTFLAARASENPEGGGGGGGGGGGETSTGSIAAGPQVALTLLKNADAKDADASRSGSLLATLIVACAATEPRVRAAAAAAIAALAPGKKSVKKSSPSAGVVALWSSLKDAAGDIGSVAKSVDAREVLVDAIARGLDVKQTGSSESTNDAIGEILAPVAATGGGGKAKESYILARLHDDDDDDDGSSEVRVDAYGARVLVAVLAGVGDDAVKAAALAPALRRCLLLGGGDGGGDLAALAVNLLEVYTPAFAKAAKNTRDASWTAYADALRPPSPAPARVAAMCVATPAFVDALPAAARGECLGALFAAVGGDPDAGARAAARDAVDALKVSAADVIEMLQTATAAAKALVSGGGGGGDDDEGKKSKRAKGAARASGDAPAASASDAVSAAIAALEVVAWKSPKDIERRGDIAGPCMDLLSALLDAAAFAKRTPAAAANDDGDDDDDDTARPAKGIAAGEASGGYAQALVMSTLETLANEQRVGRGGDAAETSSTTAWSYALVVRAVRDAEPGPAREAALSLLAAVARSDPAGAVDHVLEVSSALTHGATDKGSDDPLARRALERALAAVVPAWIAGGHGVAAAAAKVVDALPDAPAHRRGPLCGALLRACPPGEGLPRVLLLMLGNMKTLEEAATKAAEKRAKVRSIHWSPYDRIGVVNAIP